MEGQSGRLGRADGQRGQGWWLRASERTWAVDLHSRPMDTASEELVLGGERSTSSCCSKISTPWSPLLRTRWEEVSWQNGSAEWQVVLLPYKPLSAQDKGMKSGWNRVQGGQ